MNVIPLKTNYLFFIMKVDRTEELFSFVTSTTTNAAREEQGEQEELIQKSKEEFEFISEAYAVLKAIEDGLEEKACIELIDMLEEFSEKEVTASGSFFLWKPSVPMENEQRSKHWAAVLWFLKRKLDCRKKREEESKCVVPKSSKSGPQKLKEVRVLGPAKFTDDALQATFSSSAASTWQVLEQEATQLSARHSDLSRALQETEETLGTIDRLQNLILSELAWQEERVIHLEAEAGVTRERVDKGNRMIERAVQTRGGAMTVMTALIAFFAFLLLLHIYS